MSKKTLIAYASKSGSTREVAEAVGKTLSESGVQVEVRSIKDVQDVSGYEAVIVGGPMILGWHRDAAQFVQRADLKGKTVACFVTCLELATNGDPVVNGIPVTVDPAFVAKTGSSGFKARFTGIATYLKPISAAQPVEVGFFKGKLDYKGLDLFSRLFVQFVIRGKAGDYRNWDAIRAWAASLSQKLN